jgi:hypothetical protein
MAWLQALLRRARPRQTILPPEPFDAATALLDEAVTRTRSETRSLQIDGSDLAARIRRNARAGRDAFEGKP